MTDKEVKHHWNYFCSLCDRLQVTTQYVDHSSVNNQLINGNVNSFEFQQIILLASMEFENIGKAICLHIDKNFNTQYADIKKISETILTAYPQIGKTEIISDYQILIPLDEWRVKLNQDNKKHVYGIPWWDDYDNLKHQSYQHFHLANLRNAVNSLASLLVLELYLMNIELNSVNMSFETHCKYFSNNYTSQALWTEEKPLPDFVKT